MKSMTGFGAGKAQTPSVQIECSLRAVNGRFLEIRMHSPREFLELESEIKKKISKVFERGTLDLFVSRKVKKSGLDQSIRVNLPLAKKYYQASQAVAKHLKLKNDLNLESLFRLPEVLSIEEEAQVDSGEKKALLKAIDEAIENCNFERKREGKSLQKEILDLLNSLSERVINLENFREKANQQLAERMESRLKSKRIPGEVEASRLAQEVALLLEKSDINEELQRLTEHIENYRKLVKSADSNGKKLDFYTQELLREVNTIGSKSHVTELTEVVVECKTFVERLREQVQNAE